MKKHLKQMQVGVLFLIFCAITFGSCQKNDSLGLFKKDDNAGNVPDSVIPEAIRSQLDSLMPIYTGTTPPDISGEFLANNLVLVGSSLGEDASEIGLSGYWADLYFAFTKSNGKYTYQEKNASATGSGDDVTVTVTVVGSNKNFTAYFIDNSSSSDFTSKQSTVISGTMSSDGISGFYYAFIMLDKNDPDNELVPINTYRVFKDGDGWVDINNWVSDSQVQMSYPAAKQQVKSMIQILQK